MFHIASTLVTLSIVIPTLTAPIRRSLTSDWSEDLNAAEQVVGIAGQAVDIGTKLGHEYVLQKFICHWKLKICICVFSIGSVIDQFKNKKNKTQKRRSFEELSNREEEIRGIYQIKEPKNIEFVEARKFSLENVLHRAGDVVKDVATVGGVVKDVAEVGEAAAVFVRDYDTDIDELD